MFQLWQTACLTISFTAGYDTKYLQRTIATPLELARKRFPRPSVDDLNEALDNSIAFLVVREPFERLLSAYRNKMEDGKNTYYKLLGDQIVKKFRTVPIAKIVSFDKKSKNKLKAYEIYSHRKFQGQHSTNFYSSSFSTISRAAVSTSTGAQFISSVHHAASTLH